MKKQDHNIPDDSLIALFLEELRGQTISLEESFTSLKKEGPRLSVYKELLRIAHSLKGAAKLINLEIFVKTANILEALFKNLFDRTIVYKEEYSDFVEEVIAIFKNFSDCSGKKFFERLEENKKYFQEIFDKYLLFFPENNQVQVSGKKIPENNQPEKIEAFLKKLRIEAELLSGRLAYLKTDFENPEILEELINVSENIYKMGTDFELPIVIRIGEALTACFKAAFNEQLIWTQGHMDLLLQAADFLKRLSNCNGYNMYSWLNKHEKGIEAIAYVIFAISKEASSIPGGNKIKKKSRLQAEEEKREEAILSDHDKAGDVGPFVHDSAMLDLFYGELEQRVMELNEGFLALETDPGNEKALAGVMRAAHSLKGAAKIVEINEVSQLANAVEDFFSFIQENKISVTEEHIDKLLRVVDLFSRLSQVQYSMIDSWIHNHKGEIEEVIRSIPAAGKNEPGPKIKEKEKKESHPVKAKNLLPTMKESEKSGKNIVPDPLDKFSDSFIRVSSRNLNKLMGLAGESLVESRWLVPFSESLILLKRNQNTLSSLVNKLSEKIEENVHDHSIPLIIKDLKGSVIQTNRNL